MTIKVAISHHTLYTFDRNVSLAPHIIRLRPAPHSRTPVEAYSLKVEPSDHFINWQQDPFGNYLARLVFTEKTRELCIDVELIADMTVINPFDFFLDETAEYFPFEYSAELKRDLAPYLEILERGELLLQRVKKVDRGRKHIVDFLVELNHQLQTEIGYVIRMEPGVQSCEKTLRLKTGSCRDSAWLLVQLLRHLGLAARFVSGYLVQLTADEKSLDGPSGPEQDFTDLHAWAEVYIPGAGWIGLDPTSGLFAGEGHIPLACTPEPGSAAPITGATSKCEVKFHFSNTVRRIHEDPRVTKPYTEEQWQSIIELGNQVDGELAANDIRLTMGGEPTFVSIDDMESAQWNTAALGDDKLRLAENLVHRLQQRFAPGGVLHYGQGKWYPGEPLPRWALNAYWRRDGRPVWRDLNWLAQVNRNTELPADADHRFVQALARELSIADNAVPAYEDTYYYLWKEGRLPVNTGALDNKLDEPLERERLRRLYETGLEQVTGYVLPLRYQQQNAAWVSGRWSLRGDKLFLAPGDFPIGFRLPIQSLQWVPPEQRDFLVERDPFEARGKLPDFHTDVRRTEPVRQRGASAGAGDSSQAAEPAYIYTALCTEIRNGKLHVFMPPLERLEEWLELVATIENVAVKLKLPVILEGYPPPNDTRLNKLSVTPDPGVIEVNVHPAANWPDLVELTTTLYEDARQSRLGTEKFMLDGKHSGTGGGNHVTLGGAVAADSPFLRRPDLLRSLVTYWQNHPSLSYLFSGLFIGPTSQAPRVDEARDDNLHELEIAFAQLPQGENDRPWLVDRVLRNFLVDLTGNTHRSEFCIDKLYSPQGPAGRLGLVEFRGFEMPPHARMSCVQMLLLRSLISHFWQQPLRRKLIRWGTQLHDRFMLPYFVWEDFNAVISHLNNAGYPFDIDWFAPFYEFRFPRIGTVFLGPVTVELRTAIEPWPVLGEESGSQGTSRYVDSSMERLQVSIRGLTPERYQVTCNGHALPLHATGIHGEYVAGVRYKAWAPFSALHPTIGVHAPLVFDVYDKWNRLSLGGCTYHVSHPGGRNYDTFPVNANEAEARRVARFWKHGYTQGYLDIPEAEVQPEHPYTLDLRRH